MGCSPHVRKEAFECIFIRRRVCGEVFSDETNTHTTRAPFNAENLFVKTNKKSFRSCFCERFNCPDSEYEERAFTKCLYLRARCLVPLLRLYHPSLFDQDFELLRRLGNTTGRLEASIEILKFHDLNLDAGFLRGVLRIRVSGRKVSLLAARLFGKARYAARAAAAVSEVGSWQHQDAATHIMANGYAPSVFRPERLPTPE
jgi:hypothetical protein